MIHEVPTLKGVRPSSPFVFLFFCVLFQNHKQIVRETHDNDDNRNAGFHAYHKSKTAEQEKEVKRIQRNIKLVEELLCLLDGAGYKDDGNLVEGFKKRRTELQV